MEIWQFGKFVGFSKLDIFRIFKLKIDKVLEFFQIGKPKLDSKNWQILELFVRLIFRTVRNFSNIKISNIKITKDELCDFFISVFIFIFFYLFKLFEHSKVFTKLEICGILIVFQNVNLFLKLNNFINLIILWIF